MNLPQVLMGVAAGIGILAALTHGLVGFARRPRDRARIAFAIAAAAAAVGALSVLALYAITDIDLHIAVMKWAYFPATVVWTVAIVWFVAFVADVRPRRFLYALTAGFAFTLVVNLGAAARDPARGDGRPHGDGGHRQPGDGHDRSPRRTCCRT